MKKTLALLLLASTVWADPCTTIDATGFNQDQIDFAKALAQGVAATADPTCGNTSVSQVGKILTICFENQSFDASIITIPALIARYQADVAARAASNAQIDAWNIQLSTTTTALNNARVAGFKNLSAVNQTATVQGLLDREYLKIKLGIDEK